MEEKKKVRTIHDLAALAGVSAATVSRALAGKSLVNAKTADRIRKLAEAHNFRPSAFARNLRIRRRGAIGVVIPLGHDRRQHISDPFFMTMIGHLADELTERGFDLLLSRVIPDSDDWLEEIIARDRVDGLILIGQSDQSATLDAAARHYHPMIAWGGHRDGQVHCSIGTDNLLGGKIAVDHLIEQGCRRIAFFGDACALEIGMRLEGARAAVAAHSGTVELIEIPTHLATEISGVEIAEFLDTAHELPDGIFAASDAIALNAIQVLSSRGIAVPGDVRVVGFDDLPFSASSIPALTTVRQNLAEGTRLLIDNLLKRIEGETAPSVTMPPLLVKRASA